MDRLNRWVMRNAVWLAATLLTALFAFGLASLLGDAATIDERAHIPAGYTYLTLGDMRLNPEHPPLVKDLAGASLWLWSKVSGTDIVVPTWLPSWTTEANGQWNFGPAFLYDVNSNSRALLTAGRLPTLLALVGFGAFFFWWIRKYWGTWAGLIALTLFCFSPTIIAHGRLVTTDTGAAAALFITLVVLLAWMRKPTPGRFWLAVLTLGLALLVKFSVLILLPLGFLLVLLWQVTQPSGWKVCIQRAFHYLLIVLLAVVFVVAPWYSLHVRNYPADKQQSDIPVLLPDPEDKPVVRALQSGARQPMLRGLTHYATGLLMVRDRTRVAGKAYFQEKVHPRGQRSYFPVLYGTKEPLGLHFLTLIALIWALARLHVPKMSHWREWIQGHFFTLSFCLLIAFYWYISLGSDLNIGLRHVLPTFPFIFALVALGGVNSVRRVASHWRKTLVIFIGAALLHQTISVIRIYPSYLSYYNAMAGGPDQGWKIAADSNVDWGQDYNRLVDYVRKNRIPKISMDYFGESRWEQDLPGIAEIYHVEYGPTTGWLAISQTFLSFERARGTAGFNKIENRYAWLDAYTPVTTLGHSIVVYNIPR